MHSQSLSVRSLQRIFKNRFFSFTLSSQQLSMEEQHRNSNPAAINNKAHLDTTNAQRAVWLMKCPPVVSRSLKPPSNPAEQQSSNFDFSRPVGKVILSIDPLSNEENQYTMELAGTESGNVPKCYTMDMSKDFIPMSVFSESSQGKLSVEGKVHNKFDIKPQSENIEEYGKLCRERTNRYMTKTRQVQVIDNDRGTHMRPMPGMIGLRTSGPTQEKKKVPVKASDMKRTRRDRVEMEHIMFKLFEREPNWTLKKLLHETDQPEQFLKDLLKDLCVYNNKGANQGTYELKPEYKKSVDDSAATM